MNTNSDNNAVTATTVAIALNEVFPESNYGAIPTTDQRDALIAYLAFDDGVFDEAPQALAAYINCRQRYTG